MDKRKEFLERLKVNPVEEQVIEGKEGLPDFLTPEGTKEKLESFNRLLKSGIIDKAVNASSANREER